MLILKAIHLFGYNLHFMLLINSCYPLSPSNGIKVEMTMPLQNILFICNQTVYANTINGWVFAANTAHGHNGISLEMVVYPTFHCYKWSWLVFSYILSNPFNMERQNHCNYVIIDNWWHFYKGDSHQLVLTHQCYHNRWDICGHPSLQLLFMPISWKPSPAFCLGHNYDDMIFAFVAGITA